MPADCACLSAVSRRVRQCARAFSRVAVTSARICAVRVQEKSKYVPFHWGTSGLISTGICARVQQWQKGQTPARAGRIHLSFACHPSFPVPSPGATGALSVPCLLAPRSQVRAETQQYSLNCYLLCFHAPVPPLSFRPSILFTSFPSRYPFCGFSGENTPRNIYILHVFNFRELSLSTYLPLPPLSLSLAPLSHSLSLSPSPSFSALLLKFSICASSPSNRQPSTSLSRARAPPASLSSSLSPSLATRVEC